DACVAAAQLLTKGLQRDRKTVTLTVFRACRWAAGLCAFALTLLLPTRLAASPPSGRLGSNPSSLIPDPRIPHPGSRIAHPESRIAHPGSSDTPRVFLLDPSRLAAPKAAVAGGVPAGAAG